jgi:hypothetical protein
MGAHHAHHVDAGTRLRRPVKAVLIYHHSDTERQREVAAALDSLVQAERQKATDKPDDQASGTERARDT